VRRDTVRLAIRADQVMARKIANTNLIVNGRFKPHAVRDGNLIIGHRQYSGVAATWLVIQVRLCGGT
jgi:hypothetical protein